MKNILFMAYHNETLDENGKIETPACIITIEQTDTVDCFGEKVIAKLNQRYARHNRKIGKVIQLDMFKGKQGIKEDFYNETEIVDYLKMLVDENYLTQRMTRHLENELADSLYSQIKEYSLNQLRKNGAFKLPS